MKKIIIFYGEECPHCHAMLPLADRLSKEEHIEVEKLEIWHNKANADKMRAHEDLIRKASGGEFGVPALLDLEEKRALVGETTYEELKTWLKKK